MRLSLLAVTLLVSACANLPFMGSGTATAPAAGNPLALTPSSDQQADHTKIGILLPITGPNGSLGEGMLHAARLALAKPGSPVLDAHDTAGPGGAAGAAHLALQAGDGIILGPLTSADTAKVAPIAQGANVPVLAFTSDLTQARPGVWVMGVTPEQQVQRLVLAVKADGRSRIAALLPTSGLGQALASSLTEACADAGLPPPTILTHGGTMDSINGTMQQLSDYTARHATIDQQVKDAKANPDPAVQATAATLAAQPIAPPPFDALLLGDTGVPLQEVISVLAYYDVTSPQVRILGPGLWGAFAGKLRALAGAWYASPDPSARLGFAQQYQARYHQSPKPLADIPYDAAALSRSLAASGGYSADALQRPDGFAGVDGVFTLKPDGHVRRGLAIFQIQPEGGARIVQPAPATLSPTAS